MARAGTRNGLCVWADENVLAAGGNKATSAVTDGDIEASRDIDAEGVKTDGSVGGAGGVAGEGI